MGSAAAICLGWAPKPKARFVHGVFCQRHTAQVPQHRDGTAPRPSATFCLSGLQRWAQEGRSSWPVPDRQPSKPQRRRKVRLLSSAPLLAVLGLGLVRDISWQKDSSCVSLQFAHCWWLPCTSEPRGHVV